MWRSHYTAICMESRSQEFSAVEALKLENKTLNRYRDVYPYDHSRVPLTSVKKTDYINASLVEVEEVQRRYILTQGPLANTVDHFWTMVWEQKSKAVIMLNRVIEKGTLKCHPYWPQSVGESLLCEEVGLTVENVSTVPGHHYNLTTLHLATQEETREVLHFQYTTWPDFGVPTSPDAFLEFLGAVRDSGSLEPDVGPAIVHCSAGIGRSGSFILVDSCLLKAEKEGPQTVNIKETLLKMRTYRMGLIQTEDQLKFSYLSIIEGARQSGLISTLPELADLDGVESVGSSEEGDEEEEEEDDQPPPLPPPRSESLRKEKAAFTNLPHQLHSLLVNGDANSEEERGAASSGDSSDPNSINSQSSANESPTKCILNNNKIEERKREMEIRRRKKEDEKASTEERIRKMKDKLKESEEWEARKELMRERLVPFCVGLAMFLAGGYYYFRS